MDTRKKKQGMHWKTMTSLLDERIGTKQQKPTKRRITPNLSVRRYTAFLTFRFSRNQENAIFKIETEGVNCR